MPDNLDSRVIPFPDPACDGYVDVDFNNIRGVLREGNEGTVFRTVSGPDIKTGVPWERIVEILYESIHDHGFRIGVRGHYGGIIGSIDPED